MPLKHMAEIPRSEPISGWHCIDVYTPENIKGLAYDSHLQDALALLRRGIWELRDINGLEMTRREQLKYFLDEGDLPDNTGNNPVALMKYWETQREAGRQPFLLVDWNTKDGIVGIVEGRIYNFYATEEEALFVNWVVVRDSGSNDDDGYSYRGRKVGEQLYNKVEELSRAYGVTLLIAGVNPANSPSIRFHRKRGFSSEQSLGLRSPNGYPIPHPTENGAFIPSFPIYGTDSRNNPVEGAIEFHTKRLR